MAGESLIEKLEYNEAKQIIKIPKIDENHRILENTTKKISDSLLTLETPEIELSQIRTEIFFLKPDFFKSPKNQKEKFLKANIELYIASFKKLCTEYNNFISEISKGLICLKNPSLELISEINKILTQFENTIKSLCAPIISKREGLNTIDESILTEDQKQELKLDKMSIDKEILDFLTESNKLNENYNKQFSQILSSITIIYNSINDIPKPIKDYQNELDDGISNLEVFLETITDENKDQNFDKDLKNLREFFNFLETTAKAIKTQTESKCKILDNQKNKRIESFSKIKIKVKENIAKLTMKAEKIKFDINKIREKYKQKKVELPKITLAEIIVEKVYNRIDETVEKEKEVFAVEPPKPAPLKLELDLLYLMDTTGSMEEYVNATKVGLIDIMEKIIKCCDEMVNINLGFIGYKDVAEINEGDYVDMDFTKEYYDIKDKISKIIVGGGDDTAEDVAFAFERALKKNWGKESIKFAVLICDAPCHGLKYHDPNLMDYYATGSPNRENIEKLVEKLCDKNVSLCCVSLSKNTDIMYNIFEKIYLMKKNDKCQFFLASIEDPKKLADVIIKNSSIAVKEFA